MSPGWGNFVSHRRFSGVPTHIKVVSGSITLRSEESNPGLARTKGNISAMPHDNM